MHICATLRHVFNSYSFREKIGLFELLQMAAKLHIFKSSIYCAVAFTLVGFNFPYWVWSQKIYELTGLKHYIF